jgi:hypothetical protein
MEQPRMIAMLPEHAFNDIFPADMVSGNVFDRHTGRRRRRGRNVGHSVAHRLDELESSRMRIPLV